MPDTSTLEIVVGAIMSLDLVRNREDVTVDTKFQDIGMDSLDVIELTMAVEDTIAVEIPDDRIPEIEHTVGDLIKMVDEIRSAAK